MYVATINQTVESHLPTCPCPSSRHTAFIASVPLEALGQMQHVAYLQNCIDALLPATVSTLTNLVCALSRSQEAVPLLYLCKRCYHTLWMLQGPMGHASQFKHTTSTAINCVCNEVAKHSIAMEAKHSLAKKVCGADMWSLPAEVDEELCFANSASIASTFPPAASHNCSMTCGSMPRRAGICLAKADFVT
jgi:hypothetical protein